jgi:hypothetical protein
MISDGLTKTFLLGEKYLDPNDYFNGVNAADNLCLLVGQSANIQRSTFRAPMQDLRWRNLRDLFGSAHPHSLAMAMCDGSVRRISYDIDSHLYTSMGSIAGGESAIASQ